MSVVQSLKRVAEASKYICNTSSKMSTVGMRMFEQIRRSTFWGYEDFYFFPARLPKKALKELKELGLEPVEISKDVSGYKIHFSIKD